VHGRVDHASLGRSLHQVGHCLLRTGRDAEAQPWLERAVAEKEKGDVFGRIDHDSLNMSVQSLAQCLRNLGLDDAARTWEQRYAKAAQQ
jgi:uncharacterized protein YidB (DUF937 family)